MVLVAEDGHADLTRNHQNRRMLAVNARAMERKLIIMLDPGHGQFWDIESRPKDAQGNYTGPCTRTNWRGGEAWYGFPYVRDNPDTGQYEPWFYEDQAVLWITRRAFDYLDGRDFVKAVQLTKWDYWDLGLYDKRQEHGGYHDPGDEEGRNPDFKRSLDQRVRLTKALFARHLADGRVPVFLAIHTNPGYGYECGAFRVFAPNQQLRPESLEMGEDIVRLIAKRIGHRTNYKDPEADQVEVLYLNYDLTGTEYEPMEPDPSVGPRVEKYRALLLEVAHHNNAQPCINDVNGLNEQAMLAWLLADSDPGLGVARTAGPTEKAIGRDAKEKWATSIADGLGVWLTRWAKEP